MWTGSSSRGPYGKSFYARYLHRIAVVFLAAGCARAAVGVGPDALDDAALTDAETPDAAVDAQAVETLDAGVEVGAPPDAMDVAKDAAVDVACAPALAVTEICGDSIDNDCNGVTDDGLAVQSCPGGTCTGGKCVY